jgi:hypothetical protein
MVYGIIKLINFAHFNIFTVGVIHRHGGPADDGLRGASQVIDGLPLIGLLALVLFITMSETSIG